MALDETIDYEAYDPDTQYGECWALTTSLG